MRKTVNRGLELCQHKTAITLNQVAKDVNKEYTNDYTDKWLVYLWFVEDTNDYMDKWLVYLSFVEDTNDYMIYIQVTKWIDIERIFP